ncbi:MAG: hypothetical protein IJN41_01500 [Firmicutes bacterium]|nr:hypothetical protein [Bacillota bacterium]
MNEWNRPALRVILLTTGFCLGGLILKAMFPEMILPKSSLTIYGSILVLAHLSSPVVEKNRVWAFDWLISLTALTVIPACAGVAEGPLWKALLVDAVFSAAVILVLDSISRRSELRKTDRKALWIHGLLLILAIQGFDHMVL